MVVILADRDKRVEMEEELKAQGADGRGTGWSAGPAHRWTSTTWRSAATSRRSVVRLAPDSDDPDAEVIKTLLALTHAGAEGPRIVAEIQNPSNLETAALVGANRTVLLDIRETVANGAGAPAFRGDVALYRRYLVNHEVGHLLGHGHVSCQVEDRARAPVMMQQTKGVGACRANGRPLAWERG